MSHTKSTSEVQDFYSPVCWEGEEFIHGCKHMFNSIPPLRKSVINCKKDHRFEYILGYITKSTHLVLNVPLSSLIPSSNREKSRQRWAQYLMSSGSAAISEGIALSAFLFLLLLFISFFFTVVFSSTAGRHCKS